MGTAVRACRRGQSGQTLVEGALTLPLAIFMFVGSLQLFMMLQARIMTQYAAFRVARTGSISSGDCTRMTHAAVGALFPTYATLSGSPGSTPGEQLANGIMARIRSGGGQGPDQSQYDRAIDRAGAPLDGPVVWVFRPSPPTTAITYPLEDSDFDSGKDPVELQVKLVYWYPMRIPFANWVIARIMLAKFALENYTNANPLMPTQQANWQDSSSATPQTISGAIATELRSRIDAGQFLAPIVATYTMRMMTPARRSNFQSQDCPPAP